MSNYVESKQKLDEIHSKYMCAGDIIFRVATQYVVEHGQSMLSDESWQEHFMFDIDKRHDEAKKAGKILFCTRSFEKAIFECAFALAEINPLDFLIYIQKEIYLGGDGISYSRAIQLCKNCLNYLVEDTYELEFALNEARDLVGFDDEEIRELGFEFMLDIENEEE